MGECVLMALSLTAIVSFKPETSTPANLLSFAEREATRQLRRLSAPHPGSAIGDAPLADGIDARPSPTVCLRYDDLPLRPARLLSKIHQRTFVSIRTGGRHGARTPRNRSEEHTSELQSLRHLV